MLLSFAVSISEYIAAATGVGPGKEVILAANSNAAQGALGRIVVEAEAAVLEATAECWPARPHIAEGRRELGFARELGQGLFGPSRQCLGDRL